MVFCALHSLISSSDHSVCYVSHSSHDEIMMLSCLQFLTVHDLNEVWWVICTISFKYKSSYLPESVIKTSLMTNIHTVGLGYNKSMAFSWISLRLSVYIPSSAPTSICWLWVSGWIHEAVQLIRRGQPLNTYNDIEGYERMMEIIIYSNEIHWQLYNRHYKWIFRIMCTRYWS